MITLFFDNFLSIELASNTNNSAIFNQPCCNERVELLSNTVEQFQFFVTFIVLLRLIYHTGNFNSLKLQWKLFLAIFDTNSP